MVGALRDGRGALVEASAGGGKTELLCRVLSSFAAAAPDAVLRLEAVRGRWVIHTRGDAATLQIDDAGDLQSALDEPTAVNSVLVVDDIDTLPWALLDQVTHEVLQGRVRLLASLTPRAVQVEDADCAGATLEPLVSQGMIVRVPLPALSFDATRALGLDYATFLGVAEAPDDAWLAALHRFSGGIPALVVELVAEAAANQRLGAFEPLDLRTDPVSSPILSIARRLTSGLRRSQTRTLVILGEIGAVPSSHLSLLASATTISALADARLLSAATDDASVAAGQLVAWFAAQRVDGAKLRDQSASAARRLLEMCSRGVTLSAQEEMFCARHSADAVVAELSLPEQECLHGMLGRASLAVARSRTPGDAVALAERALQIGPSVEADVAMVLAASRRGDNATAVARLQTLETPKDRAEAELLLEAYFTQAFILDGERPDLATELARVRAWFANDVSWLAFIDGLEHALRFMGGADVVLTSSDFVLAPPEGVTADDLARRAALEALVEAMRGRGSRAIRLIEPRHRVHSLGTEPLFEVFVLHAFVLVMLGFKDDQLALSLRRRLAAARAADRQDQIQLLAVINASLSFELRDSRAIFASLSLVETDSADVLSIWLNLLRACAHLLSRDLAPAAELLERAACVPQGWAGGSFAAVRDVARVLFELAGGQAGSARQRALRAARDAELTLPAGAVTLLNLAHAAGVPSADVLEHAERMSRTVDMPRLAELLSSLRLQPISAAPVRWEVLTAREREVVAMAVGGLTSAEIARRLRLSPRTVESHLHHARARLGMSRSQRFSELGENSPIRPSRTVGE